MSEEQLSQNSSIEQKIVAIEENAQNFENSSSP